MENLVAPGRIPRVRARKTELVAPFRVRVYGASVPERALQRKKDGWST
jgi:hypothetical protein